MPILTLSTDIGQRDFIVGAIKGQFLQVLPDLVTADITHQLSQTNLPLAAYTCGQAIPYFPVGSYHLILVNFFENRYDHVLLAAWKGQYLICADNGLLTMITGEKPAHVVKVPVSAQAPLLTVTADIAAAVYKLESMGDIKALGPLASDLVEKYPLRPTVGPDWIEGQILFIDNFENVVVNITQQEFDETAKGRSFRIMFRRDETIDRLSVNYSDVPTNDKMAWFNSAGYLELALRNGNMAGLFGLQGYNEQMQQNHPQLGNKLFYQTIRVFFD
ncbi:MAG: hypothetical protein EAZ62_01785 [Sphingobacteriia bacterium]|nr:MAG: hypothetical protein EAZ62_01785 [Sphingobacteriia bacterium]